MRWEVVIGLETHSQLSTRSKIFSGASVAFGAAANSQACAVDIALPGVLPVANRGAVERAIRFGLAVGATISRRSVFARKNYFYPDLPKGYQISQYEIPVVVGGTLRISSEGGDKTIHLTRAHLEEDAGKSLHEDFHGMSGIDLNRAGTPLLEIVTEPDLRSAQEAVAYAKTLHALVRWIDICDGNMQEGSFRCDANVSVRPLGEPKLGTRCEVKNLNSFRFLERAIEYEVRRQIDLIESGGSVVQETRLYDSDRDETRPMRSKEDAHDYRYFPDPDLPPLAISEEWIARVRDELPELPQSIQARYKTEHGLSDYDAAALTASRDLTRYFEAMVAQGAPVKTAANWLINDICSDLNRLAIEIGEFAISPGQMARLIAEVQAGGITVKTARDSVYQVLLDENLAGDWREQPATGTERVEQIIESRGLRQMSDIGAIEKMIDDILAAHPDQLREYRTGKEKAFNFFVGQAMKASKGKASPTQISDILRRKMAAPTH
jgi:aspartyl-tRNA(Asn)/glutamyl-tRNA(Gln) amidotransferase subunit B